jgi:hypothetical protein
MSTQDKAQSAIAKLDGQPFGGRRLKVAIANLSVVRPDRPRKGMIGGARLGGSDAGRRRGISSAPFAFPSSDTEARVRQSVRDLPSQVR